MLFHENQLDYETKNFNFRRRSDTKDNRKVKRPKKKSPPPPPKPQWSQNENEPPPMINHERQIDQNSRNAKKKEADFLLFGGDSDDSGLFSVFRARF